MLNETNKFNIKNGHTALVVALAFVLGLLVFKLGMVVGFHEARFSMNSLNQGFYRVSVQGPQQGDMPFGIPVPFNDEFTGGHGAVGRVVGISFPNFVVASPDNFEKTIIVGSSTMIRKFRNTVGPETINLDDYVSVLGNPNASGSVNAKFIRVLPTPDQVQSMQSR